MRKVGVAVVALVLMTSTAGAKAEGVVPVEGSWAGESSAALPIHFGVEGGRVVNPRVKFKWGFCGVFELQGPSTGVDVDPTGNWGFEDSRGQTVAATFVAPDRVEGTIVSVERMTPSCPRVESTFSATPVPPNPESFGAAQAGIEALPFEIGLRLLPSQNTIIGNVRGSLGERFRFYLFVNRSAPRRLGGVPEFDRDPLKGGKLAKTDALFVTPPRRSETKAQRRERRRILAAVADTVCLRQTGEGCRA
jgi:hypothetical protein